MADHVFIAITMDDDAEPLRVMQLLTKGRGSALPFGATWDAHRPGWWTREPTPETIIYEVYRSCPRTALVNGVPVNQPQPVRFRVVQPEDLPTDRTFRDALVEIEGTVQHHLGKAKGIHRDHIRQRRAATFPVLDAAYQRADEQGDAAEKARIAALKQALRDLPAHPDIDAATTVDDLKAVWHEALT